MTTKEVIEAKTADLARQLGVAGQLESLSTSDKLREIGRRLGLIGQSAGEENCLKMAALADKYHCA